jgi:uncharacterized membrane protein (DUF485 family)
MSDSPAGEQISHADAKNARLGMWFFAFYVLLYGGFIVIALIDYRILAKQVFGGINLAVAYGMLLIVAAIVLAVVYANMATAEPEPVDKAAAEI